MKKPLLFGAFALFMASGAFAQEPQLDSALLGRQVLDLMPDGVKVIQSDSLSKMLAEHIQSNASREITGYRIRIYFDNSQKSRGESEALALNFSEAFPDVPVYRTFSSPYFKVTVGDYRTRSEALAALKGIKAVFPAAFIVKDKVKFPSL